MKLCWIAVVIALGFVPLVGCTEYDVAGEAVRLP
jgi:hypothetical protein